MNNLDKTIDELINNISLIGEDFNNFEVEDSIQIFLAIIEFNKKLSQIVDKYKKKKASSVSPELEALIKLIREEHRNDN